MTCSGTAWVTFRCRFEITWQTFDLHKNEPDWNLRTEHEGMFSEQGIPIKALIARKGPDSSVTWVEPKELARRLEPEEEAEPRRGGTGMTTYALLHTIIFHFSSMRSWAGAWRLPMQPSPRGSWSTADS